MYKEMQAAVFQLEKGADSTRYSLFHLASASQCLSPSLPPPPPSLCLILLHAVNAVGQQRMCGTAESHREFVSPRAELQNSTGFRSAS